MSKRDIWVENRVEDSMSTRTNEKPGDIAEIECWAEAREFVSLIYELTSKGDFKNDALLRETLRKDSIAVMGTIADGFHRGAVSSFRSCLEEAKGLLGSTVSHLYIAHDQNYLTKEELNDTLAKAYTVGIKIKSFLKNI